jgi:hypothetical protein
MTFSIQINTTHSTLWFLFFFIYNVTSNYICRPLRFWILLCTWCSHVRSSCVETSCNVSHLVDFATIQYTHKTTDTKSSFHRVSESMGFCLDIISGTVQSWLQLLHAIVIAWLNGSYNIQTRPCIWSWQLATAVGSRLPSQQTYRMHAGLLSWQKLSIIVMDNISPISLKWFYNKLE